MWATNFCSLDAFKFDRSSSRAKTHIPILPPILKVLPKHWISPPTVQFELLERDLPAGEVDGKKRGSFLSILGVLAAFLSEAEIHIFQPLLFYRASATSKTQREQQELRVSSWHWKRRFEMQSSIGKSLPATGLLQRLQWIQHSCQHVVHYIILQDQSSIC